MADSHIANSDEIQSVKQSFPITQFVWFYK